MPTDQSLLCESSADAYSFKETASNWTKLQIHGNTMLVTKGFLVNSLPTIFLAYGNSLGEERIKAPSSLPPSFLLIAPFCAQVMRRELSSPRPASASAEHNGRSSNIPSSRESCEVQVCGGCCCCVSWETIET